MADEKDGPPDDKATGQGSYTAPSRVGLVSVAAYVSQEVRQEVKMVALEKGVTVQRLLCTAINDVLEANGRERLADETARPRGGAAHRHG